MGKSFFLSWFITFKDDFAATIDTLINDIVIV